ncbi:hypothetical protein [Desulforamulus aquiferis]|uniref:Ribbon-helix-helix protein CopG domain-containing protein n=1 Tax=Desulforamulus aquiferis TaxID=1397668 RepID=A0AAW7Z8V8_9FIRM|nr:hypothetical protein [Desulforamulus aquiferis]MDO7786107.1 hypothetical protein [Desulforamulus aquiferis]
MTSEQIQARLSKADFTLADIDSKAAELGMNRTEFVLTAVEMLLGFDVVFYNRIKKTAKSLNIPVWLVMQNKLIKRFAEDAAKSKVWGGRKEMLIEFMHTAQGPITGEELFNIIRDMRVKEEEQKLVELLLEREIYRDLSPEDKKVLIRHRRGKTWLESEEYKREQEIKAQIARFNQEHGIVDEPEFDPDEIVTDEELEEWTKDHREE